MLINARRLRMVLIFSVTIFGAYTIGHAFDRVIQQYFPFLYNNPLLIVMLFVAGLLVFGKRVAKFFRL